MNGLPGPYIKFFLLELGHEGTSQYPCAFQLQAAAPSRSYPTSLLVWSFCFFDSSQKFSLLQQRNVNTAHNPELLTKNRPQPHAGRLFDARRVGTLHVRVQRGSRDGARSFRRSHGRQDRCGARPGPLRMGSGVRGGGYRVDVGVFFFHEPHPFSALRKFVGK
jgi:hypothetical protein